MIHSGGIRVRPEPDLHSGDHGRVVMDRANRVFSDAGMPSKGPLEASTDTSAPLISSESEGGPHHEESEAAALAAGSFSCLSCRKAKRFCDKAVPCGR